MANTAQQPKLVDEIIYLASLASQPRAIESLLDDLREVTALAGGPITKLAPQDVSTLTRLRQRLKNYLISKEPLRSFTAESLEAQVFDHFEGHHRMRVLRWMTAAIILASAAIVILPDLLLGRAGMGSGLESQTLLTPIVLYGAPATLFLLALRDFAPKMRQAYSLVCGGICLLGVAAIHEVLLDVYLANTIWAQAGGEMFGYGLAFLVIYIGIRKHARLMDVQGWFTRLPVLLGAAAAGWVVVAAGGYAVGSFVHGLQLATTLAVAVVLGFGAIGGYKILRASSKLYARAVRWLQWSLVVHVYAVAQYAVAQLMFPNALATDLALAVLGLPYMLAALLLFIAGYTFNRVGRY